MAVKHSIWTVGGKPAALEKAKLPSEQKLEDMIVAEPEILSADWMIIGQQETTPFGGRIDLLAMAPDGSLILIEVKKDKTPRDVVAQAIDYASWVKLLQPENISAIYERFSGGGDLTAAFGERFGTQLDDEMINQSHEIIIVAAELDPSSERIVAYLNDHDIPINVITFQVFQSGDQMLLSRAWFVDPTETQIKSSTESGTRRKSSWNGESYVSYGEGNGSRSWEDAVELGFVSGGGGKWYSRTLSVLNEGDRIWVKEPLHGFVGVGEVLGSAVMGKEFFVDTAEGKKPVYEVAKRGDYHKDFADDEEMAEYFVPVKWIATRPVGEAVSEVGLFGNQNTACKPKTPKWEHTIDRLKKVFGVRD